MSGKVDRRRYHRTPVRVSVDDKLPHSVIWLVMGIGVLLVCTTLFFVRLRSSTATMERKIDRKRGEFSVNNQKIRNLLLEHEKYCAASYIETKVDELKLGLRRPVPGQVRRLPSEVGARNRAEYDEDGLRSAASDAEDELAVLRQRTDRN